IPDEREPGAMRVLRETLAGARRTMFNETRVALAQALPIVGSGTTRALAAQLASELDGVEGALDADRPLFDRLFAAIANSDRDAVNRTLLALGGVEHDADRRLRLLASRPGASIAELPYAA